MALDRRNRPSCVSITTHPSLDKAQNICIDEHHYNSKFTTYVNKGPLNAALGRTSPVINLIYACLVCATGKKYATLNIIRREGLITSLLLIVA